VINDCVHPFSEINSIPRAEEVNKELLLKNIKLLALFTFQNTLLCLYCSLFMTLYLYNRIAMPLFQMELTENACLLPLVLILKGLPYTLQETRTFPAQQPLPIPLLPN